MDYASAVACVEQMVALWIPIATSASTKLDQIWS